MVYKGTIKLAKTADLIRQQLHQHRRERVRQELQWRRAAMRVVLLEMRRRGLLEERQRQEKKRQPQPDSPRSSSPPTTPEVIDDDGDDDDYSDMSDVDEAGKDRRIFCRN